MKSPYRTRNDDSAAHELTYLAEKRCQNDLLVYVGVAIALACVASGLIISYFAVPFVLVAGCGAAYYFGRTKASEIILRLESDELVVRKPNGEQTRLKLTSIADIALDKSEVEPDIPPRRGENPAKLLVARIVLENKNGTRVYLTYDFLPYDDCIPWLVKIRVFLCRCGWKAENRPLPVASPKQPVG
jgi:CDGSH-type Zn-finger protein